MLHAPPGSHSETVPDFGPSLNKLSPGINGPTSRAAVRNDDQNLSQILTYLNSDPMLAANTDVFVTSDHGFSTISKKEIDPAALQRVKAKLRAGLIRRLDST